MPETMLKKEYNLEFYTLTGFHIQGVKGADVVRYFKSLTTL